MLIFSKLWPLASEFDIKYPNYNPVQIPKDMENVHFDKEKLEKLENGEFFSRYSGSNWWVLDGSKTETGKPILSNDPHLIVSLREQFLLFLSLKLQFRIECLVFFMKFIYIAQLFIVQEQV